MPPNKAKTLFNKRKNKKKKPFEIQINQDKIIHIDKNDVIFIKDINSNVLKDDLKLPVKIVIINETKIYLDIISSNYDKKLLHQYFYQSGRIKRNEFVNFIKNFKQ